MADGIVRQWDVKNMRGVIDSDETPGGSWTLYATLAVTGFPALKEGDLVEFESGEFRRRCSAQREPRRVFVPRRRDRTDRIV